MRIKKLTLVAVVLLFSMPMAAEAGDVVVEAGNVRVNTTLDGGINVQSGQARVNVDSEKPPVRVSRSQNQKLRNCSRRTRSRRANCRQTTTVRRTYPNTSTSTVVIDQSRRSANSRVENTQRISCRGNGSNSSQQISQTNNSGEVVVQSSISSNACR